MANAVGSTDGTSHDIYRPIVERQENYCSGHRQYHAIHTQIIDDNCGFLGHLNDAQQFALMDQLGTDLEFRVIYWVIRFSQIEETLLHSLRHSQLLGSQGIKEGNA